MKDESDSRRREILSTLTGLGLQVYLYQAPVAGRPIRAGRDDCLRALIPALLDLDVTRLVIESCDQDHHDVQTIHTTLTKLAAWDELDYLHTAPSAELLLWAADVVAWAYGKGGDWRRRIRAQLAGVTNLP